LETDGSVDGMENVDCGLDPQRFGPRFAPAHRTARRAKWMRPRAAPHLWRAVASDVATRCSRLPAVRYGIVLGLDAAATLFGLYGAFLLRLVGEVPASFALQARVAAPALLALRLGAILALGLHRWSFRMSGLPEAARLAAAMLAGSAAFGFLGPDVPRSVVVLEFFLTTSAMAAFRFAPRIVDGWYSEWHKRASPTTLRTLIVGAGATGDLLARDLQRSDESRYYVVGFIDDDPSKHGMHVSGKPVLGAVEDLPRIISDCRVSTVLLAIPSLPAVRIREILALCASCKASFKTVPGSYSRMDKRISAAMLHDLSADDLLPREPVSFDYAEIRELVEGRTLLVTGAAGSIGGEISRQLAEQGASQLVLVDMNENDLYLRARQLQVDHPSVALACEVADIRDLRRLRQLGERYRPEIVFHAAAHKHVPLMEDAPEEAVKNNVFGTLNVALMAHEFHASRLVLISTDKAVNPTSVMGATKRIAEYVVRDLARRSETTMTAVRFGNVLGSAGSVVPLFKQQIERGGPVTVTDPECTRYFMTISEAVGLVLLAGLRGREDLCVLDMGEPIRIADMAAHLITMAGLIPGIEIPIVYTGLRPGEKLSEQVLTEAEEETKEIRDGIKVTKSPQPPSDLARWLHDLQELAEAGDRRGILQAIEQLVPTYRRTPGQRVAPHPPAPAPVIRVPRATPVPAGPARVMSSAHFARPHASADAAPHSGSSDEYS
jgi:FlaA1/EpsC-like NDP-sugar epimerase